MPTCLLGKPYQVPTRNQFPAASLLLLTALACASASAETLNFEALPTGDLHTTTVNLPQAHILGLGTTFYSREFFAGAGGSICSGFYPDDVSLSYAKDLQITFTTAVSQLSLEAIGYDDGDSVTISAYAGSSLRGSRQVDTDNGAVDFSAFSGVTKLVFDDQSTGSGVAYGKFSFTSLTSPVPAPATGLLMLLGVAALGPFAGRRQAA